MLKIFAFIVVGLFTAMWASGNNVQSLKEQASHWADASSEMTGASRGGDWGNS